MAKTTDYPLFVQWYKTMDWILDKTEKMPVSTRFSMANRMAAMAIENIEYIIEAIYSRNRKTQLHKTNMNIEKLRVLFRLAHDRQYISGKQYVYISEKLNEAGKMTGGWLKQCEG